jgi:GMP synthase (glutamine-hydrolysing)
MPALSATILVLDFGSQYTPLITRRIRACGVHSECYPFNIAPEKIVALQPAGIILSGGPETTTSDETPRAPEQIFHLGCPILGICYGLQTMVQQLGGQVVRGLHREGGYARAKIEAVDHWLTLFADQQDTAGHHTLDVWMSHEDEVVQIPPGFEVILSTSTAPVAGIQNVEKHFYGLLFHPEVTHTPKGQAILEYFIKNICQCMPHLMSQKTDPVAQRKIHIQQTVKNRPVILGLSGGVDSTVLAALLHQAIGPQLRCVFVDTGLVWDSHRALIHLLIDTLSIPVTMVEAQARFLTALQGICDPEKKRKIIGQLFIEIFEEQAKHPPAAHFLAQGTIQSDILESAASPTHAGKVIKSHHNVGGLPEKMQLQLLEPLKDLFKDEVRQLGLTLGLPEAVLDRHPFPGPGLAIRIIGEVTAKKVALLRQADEIFQTILQQYGYDKQLSQAFCILLPIETVGVIGDARHYGPVIALRAVHTTDFMTAHWAHLSYDCLAAASNQIINQLPEISRVVYDISSKPPATIEWE